MTPISVSVITWSPPCILFLQGHQWACGGEGGAQEQAGQVWPGGATEGTGPKGTLLAGCRVIEPLYKVAAS